MRLLLTRSRVFKNGRSCSTTSGVREDAGDAGVARQRAWRATEGSGFWPLDA